MSQLRAEMICSQGGVFEAVHHAQNCYRSESELLQISDIWGVRSGLWPGVRSSMARVRLI